MDMDSDVLDEKESPPVLAMTSGGWSSGLFFDSGPLPTPSTNTSPSARPESPRDAALGQASLCSSASPLSALLTPGWSPLLSEGLRLLLFVSEAHAFDAASFFSRGVRARSSGSRRARPPSF